MVTKDTILMHRKPPMEAVDVPEWGGTVYVRQMTSAERDAHEGERLIVRGDRVEFSHDNVRAKLLVKCICDESGNRLFGDADAAALGQQPAGILMRLARVAARLNSFSGEDLEDIAKN